MKVYPIILEPCESGAYVVDVPDLDISTQGKDLADALYMARDAICGGAICEQDDGNPIPEPSVAGHYKADAPCFVTFVDVDIDAYRKRMSQKTVRRNIALPGWMDSLATSKGINVSKVTQDALSVLLQSDQPQAGI